MINNQSLLEQDFAIDKVIKNGNNTVIKYSSTSSSKAYELEVNKDYIFRMLTYSYGSKDIKIGENDYCRLTVKPLIWFGFQGLNKGENLVMNFANIEHDPNEVERKSLSELHYNW